jgi:vacuolar-type H+-ATPase subunit C/Vma6
MSFISEKKMRKIGPDIIDQAIKIYRSRTRENLSREDARQMVENINGFFRVLQEWAEAESVEKQTTRPVDCKKNFSGGMLV